jgi:hypothetical protein
VSVFAYFGAPRCGKSTLMRRHVYELKHDVRAFLIMDRDGKWEGRVFRSADELRRSPTLPRWCVFRGCSGVEVAELAIDLGDCFFVDDEVHRTIAERPWKAWDRSQDPKKRGHPLYAILHEGSHLTGLDGDEHQVHALLATHRPAGLPGDFCAMMTGAYIGRLQSFADAERVYREGWIRDATSPREARRILESRPVGEFSYWP